MYQIVFLAIALGFILKIGIIFGLGMLVGSWIS